MTYTFEYGEMTVKFLGSYGRATRAPLETYRQSIMSTNAQWEPAFWLSQLEAPDLTPEYSRGGQGGVELYYGNVGSLTINHYHQRVTDLIQSIIADSLPVVFLSTGMHSLMYQWRYTNVASMRQQGWDGTGSVNIGPVSLKGTYSWSDSRITSLNPRGITGFYTVGGTFNYVPTHSGNVMVSYAKGGTSVNVITNWTGAANQQNGRTPEALARSNARIPTYSERLRPGLSAAMQPGYTKSDLVASHRLTPWLSATLNVMNVGNDYTSDLGSLFPTLGRQTLLGASVRFPRPR